MESEFKYNLERKLSSYNEWAKKYSFSSCRLVHYCGVDKPNAKDVPLDDITNEIEGCLTEGVQIEWFAVNDRLFICVQEPGCPIPERDKVISEEGIEDVAEILRKAGFDENA
jgi:hypothetical protein